MNYIINGSVCLVNLTHDQWSSSKAKMKHEALQPTMYSGGRHLQIQDNKVRVFQSKGNIRNTHEACP